MADNSPRQIIASKLVTMNIKWCECLIYSAEKLSSVSKTYKETEVTRVQIKAPECIDPKLKTVPKCEVITDWKIELLVDGNAKKVPPEVTANSNDLVIVAPL